MRLERVHPPDYPTLRVGTLGTGPTLLLLHGFASGLEGWPRDQVRALASRRRLVLVDLPGHGGSEAASESDPVGSGAFAPDRVVAALVQVLEKVTGRAEADWLGYSMGGRIALHAARVGVPVRRLLLESVTPGLRSPEERAARRSRDAAWADRFESEPVASVLDDWLAQPIFASRSDLPDAERRRQRTLRLQGHGPTLSRALRELGTGSFAPAWDLLQMWGERTHLLVGARDAKYVDIAREIVEVGSRVGMEVAAGAGHAPHMETPDAWARWVERGLGADDLPEG